jgi:hypothetical protein
LNPSAKTKARIRIVAPAFSRCRTKNLKLPVRNGIDEFSVLAFDADWFFTGKDSVFMEM